MKINKLIGIGLSLTLLLASCGTGSDKTGTANSVQATEQAITKEDIDNINAKIDEQENELKAYKERILELNEENAELKKELENKNETTSSGIAESSVSESSQAEYSYIGNKKSNKFHRLTCGYLPAEHNRVYYTSREEAVNAGMQPCKRCNP